MVRHSHDSNKFDPRFTVPTVKHPDSIMVWGAFSGEMGRAGLYFLPKNKKMNSDQYVKVLEEHMPVCKSAGGAHAQHVSHSQL